MSRPKRKAIQIIGTRPQLIKVVPELGPIINTGQHRDRDMNEKIIKDRGLDILCNMGETELGGMISKLTQALDEFKPDLVIVYGDTRSTLAGAIVASGMGIDLAHVEAGLRCGDMDRPEERIRKAVDHLSDILFAPTENARENLINEGIHYEQIWNVGDVLYDKYLKERQHKGYVFVTIHRAEHVDDKATLKDIVAVISNETNVIWAMHPRTKKMLDQFNIEIPEEIKLIDPLTHVDTLNYIKDAKKVITDSGGVAREASWSGTPVKIIGETEWIEIGLFGDGNAGEKIKEILNV